MPEDNDYAFPWLDDEHFAKARGQLSMKVNALLNVFDCYGMGIYITPIADQIIDLAIDFSMRVRGDLDKQIGEKISLIDRPTG